MRTSYLASATAGCLWGTSFLCGKIAFRELSVAHMLLYRFLFASIGPVPIVWLAREPMPEARLAHRGRRHVALTGGLLIIAAAVVMSIGTQPQ